MLRTPAPTGLLLALLLSPILSASARAQPLDLLDTRPRWVQVEFEVSPPDKPGQFDTVYTRKIRAWLQPDPTRQRVRVTVPRDAVESDLLAAEHPVPGSFSDFVWVFDVHTGAVISAEVSGRVVKRLDWGLFQTDVEARIRVAMGTASAGGFAKPRRWLGQQVFGFCAERQRSDCTIVEPSGYDAGTGYVNAVGDLSVQVEGVKLRAFSPLGEAVFTELAADRPDTRLETALN